MIADDEPLEREVVSMIIRQHNPMGTQLFEARNGEEAVQIASREQMDIVFMDIKMPILDGLMAAEQIRAVQPDCRIIFLTAYDETFLLGKQAVQESDVLLKPAHPDEIEKTLEKYIPKSHPPRKEHSIRPTSNADILKLMVYIEENLQQDLGLELLSELVHLHPRYVSRLFKNETGFTITEFITIRRLKKAKHLLVHECETIASISESCGFADSSYFTRVFKKHEGMTPTQFQHRAALAKRTRATFGNFVM